MAISLDKSGIIHTGFYNTMNIHVDNKTTILSGRIRHATKHHLINHVERHVIVKKNNNITVLNGNTKTTLSSTQYQQCLFIAISRADACMFDFHLGITSSLAINAQHIVIFGRQHIMLFKKLHGSIRKSMNIVLRKKYHNNSWLLFVIANKTTLGFRIMAYFLDAVHKDNAIGIFCIRHTILVLLAEYVVPDSQCLFLILKFFQRNFDVFLFVFVIFCTLL